jgi:type II secretory pathway component PulC
MYIQAVIAQEYRDPFEPVLPAETQTTTQERPKDELLPPLITIEGVLWGTDSPSAIIDGDVYKVGDNLKNLDAQVNQIEKNTVFIMYKGKIWRMKVEKNKKEAR